MLIQPYQSVESVLTEIKKRQEAMSEMRTFLSEREKQNEMEKAIFTRCNVTFSFHLTCFFTLKKCDCAFHFVISVMSIKCDSETWEKNFNESNKILSSTLSKANEHQSRIPFVLKLMTNWRVKVKQFLVNRRSSCSTELLHFRLEQPYRMMIKNTETVEGVTLREYEEMYKKLQREKSGKS